MKSPCPKCALDRRRWDLYEERAIAEGGLLFTAAQARQGGVPIDLYTLAVRYAEAVRRADRATRRWIKARHTCGRRDRP